MSPSSTPTTSGSAPVADPATTFTAPPPARSSLYRRALVGAFTPMKRGHLRLELPDGTHCDFGTRDAASPTPPHGGIAAQSAMRVRREAFFKRCVWSGDIGFAESYIDGDWETSDLTATLAFFIRNLDQSPTLSGSQNSRPAALNLLRVANRIGHLLRPNTRANARRNIRDHYDLSNDFFSLWLDPSLMYSAAKWPAPSGNVGQDRRRVLRGPVDDARGDGEHVVARAERCRLPVAHGDHVHGGQRPQINLAGALELQFVIQPSGSFGRRVILLERQLAQFIPVGGLSEGGGVKDH